MATTLADMIAITGKEVLDHLDRSADIPVVSAAAAQGDVLVVRNDDAEPGTSPMPACLVVAASEISENTHTLHRSGPAFWRRAAKGDHLSLIGVATVPSGSELFLSHQEHGGLLLGEGTYELRRQVELGSLVAD